MPGNFRAFPLCSSVTCYQHAPSSQTATASKITSAIHQFSGISALLISHVSVGRQFINFRAFPLCSSVMCRWVGNSSIFGHFRFAHRSCVGGSAIHQFSGISALLIGHVSVGRQFINFRAFPLCSSVMCRWVGNSSIFGHFRFAHQSRVGGSAYFIPSSWRRAVRMAAYSSSLR